MKNVAYSVFVIFEISIFFVKLKLKIVFQGNRKLNIIFLRLKVKNVIGDDTGIDE